MDIEQFIQTEKQNLDRFAEYWKNKKLNNNNDPNNLESVEEWLEQFLCFVENNNLEKLAQDDSQARIAGLHTGNVWMSEDFDEALGEEFWLGESN